MTTIAYDGKSLATDSRTTIGDRIYEENCKKLFLNIGPFSVVATAGETQSTEDLIEEISGYTTLAQVLSVLREDREADGVLIAVLPNGDAWSLDAKSGFRLNPDVPYALGSGKDYAYIAMDLGLSAKDAVIAASKRDIYTNDTIQVVTFMTEDEAKKSEETPKDATVN